MTCGVTNGRNIVGFSGEAVKDRNDLVCTCTITMRNDAPYVQPRSRGKGKQRNRWNNINNGLRNEVR